MTRCKWVFLLLVTVLLPARGLASTSPSMLGPRYYPHADRPSSPGDVWEDLSHGVPALVSDIGYVYSSPLRINARSALWLGGITAVGALLYSSDQEIYDALKRNEHESLYEPIADTGEFLEPVGHQGKSNVYLVGAYAIGYVSGIAPLREIPGEILGSYIVGTAGKRLANEISGRRNPRAEEGARKFGSSEGKSFPSGHAITIATITRVLTHHMKYRPAQWATYALATTGLLQRVTSDSHWPSDVFFGAIYGWVVTDAVIKRKAERRLDIEPTIRDEGRAIGMVVRLHW